jgi:hypothetical protein
LTWRKSFFNQAAALLDLALLFPPSDFFEPLSELELVPLLELELVPLLELEAERPLELALLEEDPALL